VQTAPLQERRAQDSGGWESGMVERSDSFTGYLITGRSLLDRNNTCAGVCAYACVRVEWAMLTAGEREERDEIGPDQA
jgi:hypothetical protein